jgi:aldose 1-epimerase
VANRIADAEFTMDGAIYMVTANNNGNCLHGGDGFSFKLWKVEEATEDSVTMSYYSHDGEEGFPGGLDVKVKFTLVCATFVIEYEAIPDGKTPIALTNHSYFNLDGFGGLIDDHLATIYADSYTEVDERLIPNGIRPDVTGTPFDFRRPKRIGSDFGKDVDGYDHNFILCPKFSKEFEFRQVPLAASVTNGELVLNVYTDQPGVQFYTGNFLFGEPDFRGGVKKIKHGAFCLEAQTEPNCINHGIGFYDAGETYRQITVYEVSKKV